MFYGENDEQGFYQMNKINVMQNVSDRMTYQTIILVVKASKYISMILVSFFLNSI